MDVLYFISVTFLVVGGIWQILETNAAINRNATIKPSFVSFFTVWVIVFCTWPYWVFLDIYLGKYKLKK